MPAYVIATTNVDSPQQHEACCRPAGIITARPGGSFGAGDGGATALKGTFAAGRDVIVERPYLFDPSPVDGSQKYRAMHAALANAAAFTLVAVSG